MIQISVTQDAFHPGDMISALEQLGGGAIASFTGLVRGGNSLVTLRLDHYPAMTERQLAAIASQAMERWPLLGLSIIHRVGVMVPGDRIVFVGAASSHREAALQACDFMMDWLKSAAPFWKKESFADGSSRWVEPRDSDAASMGRWIL